MHPPTTRNSVAPALPSDAHKLSKVNGLHQLPAHRFSWDSPQYLYDYEYPLHNIKTMKDDQDWEGTQRDFAKAQEKGADCSYGEFHVQRNQCYEPEIVMGYA